MPLRSHLDGDNCYCCYFLLIYENLIIVESNAVQNLKSKYKLVKDQPIADRLDRSYFGFDQDYFERMPLLVNALQENSYIEPTAETSVPVTIMRKKQRSQINTLSQITRSQTMYKSVRKTTPKPFSYEYRSPNPTPFSKNFNSRSWVESYRNAQRLKNLNQVIKYLEKTLNAKFGDVSEPSTAQIAFSGVYVAPIEKKKPKHQDISYEAQGSRQVEYQHNHVSDPLFVFKPDSPGDINLLAEGYRFSPLLTSHKTSIKHRPMFRPVSQHKRKCIGVTCIKMSDSHDVDAIHFTGIQATRFDKPRAFGVMLDLYPLKSTSSYEDLDPKSTSAIDNIYITTSRPQYQFKKKSNNSKERRTSFKPRRPKILSNRNIQLTTTQKTNFETTEVPQMVVHFNVYSVRTNPTYPNEQNTSYSTTSTSTTTTPQIPYNNIYDVQLPVLNTSFVEDYHAGSSGVIPVEYRTPLPPVYPITTPTVPQFDSTYSFTEAHVTNPPEIFKFSPEDAKVPDEYLNLRKSDVSMMSESDLETKNIEDYTKAYTESDSDSTQLMDGNEDSKMLVIKLKNVLQTTTDAPVTEFYTDTTTENQPTESTEKAEDTYVPTINGHYRSIKRKTLNILFNENSEKYRKKRLETAISFQRSTYVPMYVEIKRNRTNTSIEND
ncbi:uncharacterized protein LOC119831116 isoform X2 [Zerene cesonia]|uniref:uncharacterized protein LOC119831116 isoform X2 n=1 Tax=Zerene cesonia TaxID=33412 RepID=UPI0018E582A8|nr:uncharacterized protein LOC119831116 isoform X2 [Zerene cesonia]